MNKSPNSIFSFDDSRSTDEGDVNEKCPSCNIVFSEHTNNQLVKCALIELEGGKN